VVCPLDVLKTRLQVQSRAAQHYQGISGRFSGRPYGYESVLKGDGRCLAQQQEASALPHARLPSNGLLAHASPFATSTDIDSWEKSIPVSMSTLHLLSRMHGTAI